MKSYSEKLKDPRWQKKRLQILERDQWFCQMCCDDSKTLHVHHKTYSGKNPWDTPDNQLITLCEDCHKDEEYFWNNLHETFIPMLKSSPFLSGDFDQLAYTMHITQEIPHCHDVYMTAMCWFIEHNKEEILSRYFEYLEVRHGEKIH